MLFYAILRHLCKSVNPASLRAPPNNSYQRIQPRHYESNDHLFEKMSKDCLLQEQSTRMAEWRVSFTQLYFAFPHVWRPERKKESSSVFLLCFALIFSFYRCPHCPTHRADALFRCFGYYGTQFVIICARCDHVIPRVWTPRFHDSSAGWLCTTFDRETDLDEVLQISNVFTNVSKGQVANSDDLNKGFGKTDVNEIVKEVSPYCFPAIPQPYHGIVLILAHFLDSEERRTSGRRERARTGFGESMERNS